MEPKVSPRNLRKLLLYASVVVALVATGTVMTKAFVSFVPTRARVPQTGSGGTLMVRAPERGGPALLLHNGREVKATYTAGAAAKGALETGKAKPLSLAAYDFDANGAQDVVAGYASDQGGLIAVHRGDTEAYGPTNPQTIRRIASGRYPDPFLEETLVLEVPEAPDFLATGDFDRDGWPDVLAAARRSNVAYLLPGDGQGGFLAAVRIELPGAVTAMTTGIVGYPHSSPDAVFGVVDGGVNSVLVYGDSTGILGAPTARAVSGEVRSLAVGNLDDDGAQDVVVAAGGDVAILRGGADLSQAERLSLPLQARSIAIGEFVGDRDGRQEIAVLAADGSVSVVARDDLDTRPMSHDEIVAKRMAMLEGTYAPAKTDGGSITWRVSESVQLANKAASHDAGDATIVRGHMSTEATEDIVVVDPAGRMLHVLTAPTVAGKSGELSFAAEARTEAELAVTGAPAAVLPMRVSVDGRQGMVVLGQGGAAPAVVFPKVAATFTVTKTADTNDGTCNADCSLREAIGAANAAAGADMIVFSVNGTFQLTIAGRNENANATGDLDVVQALTITGNGSANTVIQAGTNTTNGIDKVISFNPNFSVPFAASVSGVTMQFGFNNSSAAGDGFGGAFDHEFNATGSLSVTNSVIQSCTTVNGPGGAAGVTSTGGTNGVFTVNSTTTATNLCQSNFGGGAYFVGTATSFQSTSSTYQDNDITGVTGNGGGVFIAGSPNPTTQTAFHNCVFSGNAATVDGGGIYSSQPLTLNQSSDVFSNTSGRFGGGVWLNHSNGSSTIDHCTIRNNTATTAGGGVRHDSATTNNNLTMNFCRIVDNTAPTGSGLSVLNGASSVENNWWGCNGGPTASPCDTAILSGTGSLDFNPWITLSHTASPSTILRGQTSTLTASFLQNSAGTVLTTAQISELINLPITFSAVNGTISGAEATIQADGMANATYTGTVIGVQTVNATVDGFPSPVTITVQNNPPTITAGGPLTRQQGSAGTSSQIATVADADQAANTLTVTATPPAGITVTGIAIDGSGNVTATVTALCTATTGANTVSLQVNDSNGGSNTANLTVNVTANTPPTVGTYPATSVNAGAGTTVTPSAAPADNGSVASVTAVATTPAGFTGTLTGNPTTGVITVANANPPAVYTVTVTVTDNCGATTTTTFQLTVVPPCTITCPANVTVSNTTGQCGAVVNYTAPTTTGTCGTVTCTPAAGSTFPVGTTTVNCTTTAGPSCSFTVTVNDTQAPTVTCPANITTGNTTGQCAATVTYTTPTANDNCPGATVACVPASGSSFPVGTTTVTCTATDASANTGTCTFTVTVNDTQAPTVTCPANITTSNTAGQCSATVTYTTPTANDNCPGATVSCVPASGSTFPIGTTTVTCTATDASPNSPDGTCTFTVTVNDTQNPTVTCPANITMNNTPGQCGAVVTYTTPTATDNCPGATVVCVPASGTSFPSGTTTVTCTATDASANTGTCSFTVTINDTQAPTVTCPANITTGNTTGQCAATVTYTTPTANDNCPGATVACVPASGSSFPVGTTTVTCTATDASANTGTCTFTVTVNDTQNPTITCPANVAVGNTAGQCSGTATFSLPTANDNCPGIGAVTCTPASGSTFPVGTSTVNCSVMDAAGNPASCSFTVTVNDTQNPSITCPANITTGNATGMCGAPVTYTTPTPTDNCPGATASCTPASGSSFPVGTTTVTCTATDAAGRTATCSFTVTVNDTQNPTITCPANQTAIENPPQSGSATVTYPAPTATDNCPGVTASCVPASGSSFPVGVTTVTCTATDAAGRTATCSFTVTVSPACGITCPANVTTTNDPNQCGRVVNYAAPTTVGNCGTITCTPPSGSFFPVGVTTVNCTTTVGPSCSFTVTVNDTQNPTVTCPANVTTGNTPGTCSAVVNYSAPVASDNCPGVAVVCVPASGSTFPMGTSTVNCTATDAAGNTATCAFSVTVTDTEAPAITCPANQSTTAAAGQCGANVSFPAPTVTDNCVGKVSVMCTPASGAFFPVGVTTVTCTARDSSANMASCTFTVTVTDTQAPTITCPPSVGGRASARGTDDCSLTGTVNYPMPTVVDNCPGSTVVCNPPSGTTFPEGTTTVTCTATDASGNTASCSFTVTVSVQFDVCVIDDASGDTFSIVATTGSSLYGLWRYRVAATGEVFCGTASTLAYVPGRSLTAVDADDPTMFMQATVNFASNTATVQVRHRPTNRLFVLRDRNLRNDPACQ